MTEAEKELIDIKFDNLAVLLKSSEEAICNKVSGLESKFEETRSIVNDHVGWHNSINRSIAGSTVKYGLVAFVVVVILVIVLGAKDGIIASVLAKALG